MYIRINNEEWTIEFVNSNSSFLYIGNGKYTYGATIPELRTILISNDICGELLHHVLTHELFHAEMVSRGVNVPIYIEEVLCDIVADNELETIRIANEVHNNLCKLYKKC